MEQRCRMLISFLPQRVIYRRFICFVTLCLSPASVTAFVVVVSRDGCFLTSCRYTLYLDVLFYLQTMIRVAMVKTVAVQTMIQVAMAAPLAVAWS